MSTKQKKALSLIVVALLLISCTDIIGPGAEAYTDPIAKAIANGCQSIAYTIGLSAIGIMVFNN